jgi:hypothetical protein
VQTDLGSEEIAALLCLASMLDPASVRGLEFPDELFTGTRVQDPILGGATFIWDADFDQLRTYARFNEGSWTDISRYPHAQPMSRSQRTVVATLSVVACILAGLVAQSGTHTLTGPAEVGASSLLRRTRPLVCHRLGRRSRPAWASGPLLRRRLPAPSASLRRTGGDDSSPHWLRHTERRLHLWIG